MEDGVPNLHKDLSIAITIAQHADVVKVGEEHLALTQCGIDLCESRVLTQGEKSRHEGSPCSLPSPRISVCQTIIVIPHT